MPYFENGTQKIHYSDIGSGDVVLLLHGLASHSGDWESQADSLSYHYRVIAPDFRGHGLSSPASSPFKMKDLATDVVSLLNHLNISSYHLVGFSLGGMAAFELALLDQNRIDSLTIINSGPGINVGYWTIKTKLLMRKLVISTLGMSYLGKMIGKALFPDEKHAEIRSRFEAQMQKTDRKSYENTLGAISTFNVTNQINTLQLPTLIVSSDQDYTPVSTKEAYCKLLRNAKLKVIKNSRHATPLDQPEVLTRVVTEFLTERSEANGLGTVRL